MENGHNGNLSPRAIDDDEFDDPDILSRLPGRQKLKSSFNFQDFLSKGEGQFEVDAMTLDSNPTLDEEDSAPPEKPKSKILGNCNFRNIRVEAITDEEASLMFTNFEKLAERMTNLTEDGGVKKKIDRAGQKGRIPPPNSKVWIHYTALCEGWDEPVDKDFDNNSRPKVFRLGRGEVLHALDLGVASMEVRESAKFLATPDYAYGKLGLVDRVPPNASVLFIVELLEFQELAPNDSVFNMTKEERAQVSFEDIEKAARQMRMDGNRYYREQDWDSAISKYRKGVKVLDRYVTVEKALDKKRNEMLFVLYTNLAQCYLNSEEYHKAAETAKLALDLPPKTEGNKCKAYYRRAKACFHLGRFEESKQLCKQALRLKPADVDIQVLFEKLCKRLEDDKVVEKELSKKMMAQLTLE